MKELKQKERRRIKERKEEGDKGVDPISSK